jgi:hypothetical protein
MILKILYEDKRMEEMTIKRFSDISTHKVNFYYYEKPFDEHGKGSCVNREMVRCIEVENDR